MVIIISNISKGKLAGFDKADLYVWALITDVPKLNTPWQYVCVLLNLILPGNILFLS
jgi:hypothetical protein